MPKGLNILDCIFVYLIVFSSDRDCSVFANPSRCRGRNIHEVPASGICPPYWREKWISGMYCCVPIDFIRFLSTTVPPFEETTLDMNHISVPFHGKSTKGNDHLPSTKQADLPNKTQMSSTTTPTSSVQSTTTTITKYVPRTTVIPNKADSSACKISVLVYFVIIFAAVSFGVLIYTLYKVKRHNTELMKRDYKLSEQFANLLPKKSKLELKDAPTMYSQEYPAKDEVIPHSNSTFMSEITYSAIPGHKAKNPRRWSDLNIHYRVYASVRTDDSSIENQSDSNGGSPTFRKHCNDLTYNTGSYADIRNKKSTKAKSSTARA